MDLDRFNHAIALRDSGRFEDALREMQQLAAVTSDPSERATIVLNEAPCLMNLGRLRDARRRLVDGIRISPREDIRARAAFTEAIVDWLEGNREVALEKLDHMLEEHRQTLSRPEHRDLYEEVQVRRGTLLVALGRFKEARSVLEESLAFEIEPGKRGDVMYNLGVSLMRIGELERAGDVFLRLLENGARRDYVASAHYNLGVIYSKEGAPARALQEFEWCIPHADEANIPKQNLYGWLAKVSDDLGLKADADRYDKLAKEAANQK